MAVFFTVVNLSKWIPYWQLGLIDLTNLGTSLALGPVVLAGVWTGVRLASRVKPTLFYRLVMAGMVLSGGSCCGMRCVEEAVTCQVKPRHLLGMDRSQPLQFGQHGPSRLNALRRLDC